MDMALALPALRASRGPTGEQRTVVRTVVRMENGNERMACSLWLRNFLGDARKGHCETCRSAALRYAKGAAPAQNADRKRVALRRFAGVCVTVSFWHFAMKLRTGNEMQVRRSDVPLEKKLKAELPDAWIAVSGCYAAEGAAGEALLRIAEVCVIQNVEEFRAKLKLY